MDNLINNIVLYFRHLIKDCKLNVSVHFDYNILNNVHESLASTLSPYNCHTNSYCSMVKQKNKNKCLLNQKNILEKCKSESPFCNTCHAEVYEYIYPICKITDIVGFIAVSGYRKSDYNKHNILNHDLWINTLNKDFPSELCNSVIPPLSVMLERALILYQKENINECNQILQFLNEYHTNTTLSDLAKHFNRSKSHISHLFKKEKGTSLRAYCNNLKLEDAKIMLLKTDLPITEIALNVGFNDTSYFVRLFKEKFGITPLQFRKNKS